MSHSLTNKVSENFIADKPFLRNIIAIAVPIAMQNAISFGVTVMDSVMLGSLGDVAISAANLGAQPFTLLMSFAFGLSSGGSVLIAQFWGKKDLAAIRKVMAISMRLVFCAALFFTLVSVLFPHFIMSLYSGDSVVISAAASYLSLSALSYIPYALSNNYMTSMRAVEKVKMSTVIYIVSFFINVVFNYAFIFGKFGAPALGVRGAAVGTIIARCSELLMSLIYMYTRENTVHFRLKNCFDSDASLLKVYVHHAVPVVGNEFLWGVGTSLVTLIMGRISSVFITAASIAGVLNQFMFVGIMGIANAAAVLTGRTIGEGGPDVKNRARRVANTFIALSFIAGFFNFLLVLILRRPFLSLYNITQQSYDAAYNILFVLALLQLTLAADVTSLVGILRGGGDTRVVFLYDCGALWLLSVPLGMLAGFVFKWPIAVVYFLLRIDCPIKTIFGLLRVKSGAWIREITVPQNNKE